MLQTYDQYLTKDFMHPLRYGCTLLASNSSNSSVNKTAFNDSMAYCISLQGKNNNLEGKEPTTHLVQENQLVRD